MTSQTDILWLAEQLGCPQKFNAHFHKEKPNHYPRNLKNTKQYINHNMIIMCMNKKTNVCLVKICKHGD